MALRLYERVERRGFGRLGGESRGAEGGTLLWWMMRLGFATYVGWDERQERVLFLRRRRRAHSFEARNVVSIWRVASVTEQGFTELFEPNSPEHSVESNPIKPPNDSPYSITFVVVLIRVHESSWKTGQRFNTRWCQKIWPRIGNSV